MDNTPSRAQPAPSTTIEAPTASPPALLSSPVLQTDLAISKGSTKTSDRPIETGLTPSAKLKIALCKMFLEKIKEQLESNEASLAQVLARSQSETGQRPRTPEKPVRKTVEDTKALNARKGERTIRDHPQYTIETVLDVIQKSKSGQLQASDLEWIKTDSKKKKVDDDGVPPADLTKDSSILDKTLTQEEGGWLDEFIGESPIPSEIDQFKDYYDKFEKFIESKVPVAKSQVGLSGRDMDWMQGRQFYS
ncbi:hypothetical protein F5880DRAFT_1704705 [Lentinula raphanica]|nr:hypothetical protein F5880DRAFT_1704705 [Lentinula raphanica]